MKTINVFFLAVVMSLLLCACQKAPSVSRQTGFNLNPAKLAVIPAGYELGEAVFSPDGRHVAYVTKKDGKAFVFFDAKMSSPYEDVGDIIFRKDQDDYAYISNKAGKQSVVVNGEEGAWYDSVGRTFFASDGRVIYAASKNQKWTIVSGKRESPLFISTDSTPVVSADGKRLAFIEEHSETKKSNLRVCSIELKDCSEGKKYDFVSALKTDMSHSHISYLAGKDGKAAVVTVDFRLPDLTEKESPWFDEVFIFDISDGGEHLAFLARRGDKTILVSDGVEAPFSRFDMTLELVMSKNGRTFIAGVVKDKVVVLVDGKPTGKDYSGVFTPSFSADGANYTFSAEIGSKNNVVVNGTAGPSFDKVVTPRFAPDGARVAYRARQNGERFVVVADNYGSTIREHPHYEAVWDVNFSPDGKFVGYCVRTGQEFWWKVEKLDN